MNLKKKTQQPIYQLFDLIGGTSIGGIFAAMFTAPDETGLKPLYTATRFCDEFEAVAKRIFTGRWLNPWGLRAPKYTSEGIQGEIGRASCRERVSSPV